MSCVGMPLAAHLCLVLTTPAGLVEDLGTGEYRAAFSATATGVYVVAVQLGGRNVAGSPFAAAVVPAGVCAATSAVALAPIAATAGQQAWTETTQALAAAGSDNLCMCGEPACVQMTAFFMIESAGN